MTVLLAGFHYLALGIGLGSIFYRGICLRQLKGKTLDAQSVRNLFHADNLWGLAALLWIATGLLRALTRAEKGWDFYNQSQLFWLKMGLFGLVFLLELKPMVIFVRWRQQLKKHPNAILGGNIAQLRALNDGEVLLILVIPFVASAMARGWS